MSELHPCRADSADLALGYQRDTGRQRVICTGSGSPLDKRVEGGCRRLADSTRLADVGQVLTWCDGSEIVSSIGVNSGTISGAVLSLREVHVWVAAD